MLYLEKMVEFKGRIIASNLIQISARLAQTVYRRNRVKEKKEEKLLKKYFIIVLSIAKSRIVV